MTIKLEFPHFKSKNNNVRVIKMLHGLKEITRRRAHQNTWRLARAQQVSIALPWLSFNSAEARSFPFYFLPCLEVVLSINRTALRTSLSTPSCSLTCSLSVLSALNVFFWPDHWWQHCVALQGLFARSKAVMQKQENTGESGWVAGDGLKSSQSADLVTVVGMRSRKGCRIGKGSLGRGSGPSQHRLDPRELGAR